VSSETATFDNLSVPKIKKDIHTFRKLWRYFNEKKSPLRINDLSALESLVLINKISVSEDLLPLGLKLEFMLNIGCNTRCIMCDGRALGKPSSNSYANVSKLLDFAEPEIFSQVSVVGGEPFLDKAGFIQFMKKVYSKDIPDLTVVTNGHFLTKQYLDLLIQNGLTSLTISLDSHKSEEHDKIRRIDGLFDHIIEVIKYSKKTYPHFTIIINSVIMRNNIDSLIGIVRLVNALGLDGLNIIFPMPLDINFSKISLTEKNKETINAIRASKEISQNKVPLEWDICDPKQRTGIRNRYQKIIVLENGRIVFGKRALLIKNFDQPFSRILRECDVWNFLKEDIPLSTDHKGRDHEKIDLIIELTARSYREGKGGTDMSFANFKNMIDKNGTVIDKITLKSRGSNKDTSRMVEYAKGKGIGSVKIVTNDEHFDNKKAMEKHRHAHKNESLCCTKPIKKLAIISDGTVISCHYIPGDKINKFKIGHIDKSSLNELYDSYKHQDFIRKSIFNKDLNSSCVGCQKYDSELNNRLIDLKMADKMDYTAAGAP